MYLTKLDLKDFIIFKNQSLDLPNQSQVILVRGARESDPESNNGVGKSLLLESIWFVLFGDFLRGTQPRTYDLGVQIGSLYLGRVKRRQESFALLGEQRLTQPDLTEQVVQKFFKTRSQAQAKLLAASMFYYGRRFELWFEQRPSNQTEFLQQVFGYERIAHLQNNLQTTLLTIQAKQQQEEVEKARLEGQKQQLESLIQKFRGEYQQRKTELLSQLQQWQQVAELLVKQKQSLAEQLLAKETKKAELEAELGRFQQELAVMAGYETQVKSQLQELEQLLSQGICPICRRSMDHSAHDPRHDLKTNLVQVQEARSRLEKQQAAVHQEWSRVQGEYQSLRHKYLSTEKEYLEAASMLKSIQERLQELESAQVGITEKERELSEVEELLTRKYAYLSQLSLDYQFIQEAKRDLERRAKEALAAFVSSIVERANVILALSPLGIRVGVKVKATKARSEIQLQILRGSKSVSANALSDGERQTFRLALWFATADVLAHVLQIPFRFSVLDEPLTGLDAINRELVFQLLQSRAAQGYQLFVVDHDAVFQERFDSVITVVEKRDGTREVEVNVG